MIRPLLAIAALPLATALVAQQPKLPPAPMPITPAVLPPAKEAVLPNGLRLIVVENHRLPIISVSLAFPAGRTADPSGKEGLSAMAAELLSKGAATRTADQFAAAIEQVGGTLGAGAGADFLTASGSSLSKDQGLLFDLLGDAITRPRFDSTEVELLRTQRLSGLELARSQPAALGSERLEALLYGNHPYGRTATETSTRAITRADLVGFQRSRLRPGGALLVVAGDVTLAGVQAHVARAFRGWVGTAAPSPVPPAAASTAKTTITIVHRPGSVQSNILIANLTYSPGDPRHYAAVLANRVLGDGSDSRLFKILREQKSWTYGAYSQLERRLLGGSFEATAEVRTEVTDSAVVEMLSQLNRIGTEPVPAEELEAARSAIVGSYPLTIQTAQQVANAISEVRRYKLPADYLQSYRVKIGALTAADVQSAAKALFRADQVTVVVVGDAGKIGEGLRKIAPVTIVDVDGNPLSEAQLSPQAGRLPIDAAKLVATRDSFAIRIQGNPLGGTSVLIEEIPDGKRITEHSDIAGVVVQTTTIELGADGGLRTVRQTGKTQGQPTSIELDYRGGRVKGSATTVGPDGTKSLTIDTTTAPGTIDDNSLQGLLPTLPWSPTAEWTFAVFSGGQNETKITTLKVVRTETVTLPSGPVEAFKVDWSGGWAPATFWVSTAAPHRLLKIAVANTPVEIIRVQ